MCLHKAKKIITDKDIIGFKVEKRISISFKINNFSFTGGWVSYYEEFKYRLQKLYTLKDKIMTFGREPNEIIYEAFHCFKNIEDARDFMYDKIGYPFSLRIVECILPAKSTIYEGETACGDPCYASNMIKINKVIENLCVYKKDI